MKITIILLFHLSKWHITPNLIHSISDESKSRNMSNNGYTLQLKHWNYTSMTFLFFTLNILNTRDQKFKEVSPTN